MDILRFVEQFWFGGTYPVAFDSRATNGVQVTAVILYFYLHRIAFKLTAWAGGWNGVASISAT